MTKRCTYSLEVENSKLARQIANHNMQDRGITEYRILRVQRVNLAHPDYCEIRGYKVYIEYNVKTADSHCKGEEGSK